MRNRPELLPCPFCESQAKWNAGGFGEMQPSCTNKNCGAQFNGSIWVAEEHPIHMQELADKWNTRPNEVAETKETTVKQNLKQNIEATIKYIWNGGNPNLVLKLLA